MNRRSNHQRKPSNGLVLSLARKDLRYEWVLSLCLVMAVAAVLGPILILFGLKFGSIQLLTNRLIDDPRNCEIRPMVSRSFDRSWFSKVKKRKDVAFIVPMTRQISTSVQAFVLSPEEKHTSPQTLNLLPTAENDPLLLGNDGIIPDSNSCVITSRSAELLSGIPGDVLRLVVKRILHGKYQKVTLDLKIIAILSPRAGTRKAIYVPLSILEAVEQYKDGEAVPKFGWPGQTALAYPLYDGAIIWCPTDISKLQQLKLTRNSGFSNISEIQRSDLINIAGYNIGKTGFVYFLSTHGNKGVGIESIQTIKNRLRGRKAFVFPWTKPQTVKLFRGDKKGTKTVDLYSMGAAPREAEQLDIRPYFQTNTYGKQILISNSIAGSFTNLSAMIEGRRLSFPVTTIQTDNISEKNAFIHAELAGILRLMSERTISYNKILDNFTLARRGYAGFRLYASTIETVDALRHHLENQDVSVVTKAEQIRNVKELDFYLTLVFWLIAVVAASGGLATLAASLYASIERKKKELSILRLIGFSGMDLLRFPLYQGVMISFLGLITALFFFSVISWIINSLFKNLIQPGESLCFLQAGHVAIFLVIILLITVISSISAAWRIMRLDPAEALRDE